MKTVQRKIEIELEDQPPLDEMDVLQLQHYIDYTFNNLVVLANEVGTKQDFEDMSNVMAMREMTFRLAYAADALCRKKFGS